MKRKKTDVLAIQAPAPWMEKPAGIDIDFTFWELIDELGSWFLQGAAVVSGGPYSPILNPFTQSINVTCSGIKIFFPMWGTVLTVSGSSDFDVPQGDKVILVPDIEYPVTNQTKGLQVLTAGDAVREQGQFCFYLGGRRGGTVYMRPDAAMTP